MNTSTLLRFGASAAATMLAACASDGPLLETRDTPLPSTPFFVSNPEGAPLAAARTRVQRSPQAAASVAWVSLPPGSIPGATAVTIALPPARLPSAGVVNGVLYLVGLETYRFVP